MHRLDSTPTLAPFVEYLWATESSVPSGRLESALPTGQMHLVFRLSEQPVRILAAVGDREGRRFHSVVSGARAEPYFRVGAAPAGRTVGQIRSRPRRWRSLSIARTRIGGTSHEGS